MKTVVCGGRDYVLSVDGLFHLDLIRLHLPITELVCGKARGIDTSARRWAEFNGIPIKDFPADWDRHGKAAGYIRNAEMAEYADAVVALPGGRGTDNMVQQAIEKGLRVVDIRTRMPLVSRVRKNEKVSRTRGVSLHGMEI